MFMVVSTIEAKTGNKKPNKIRVNYESNNTVNFFEHGIEFYIFTNGDFDFNTHLNDSYNDYNDSDSDHDSDHDHDSRVRNNRTVRIGRDYSGRITQIGTVFIWYDYRGNVTRIGTVSMRYKFGKLTSVGHLRVYYDPWGNPNFYGNVKEFYDNNGIRFNVSFGDICSFNDTYFYGNDFRNKYSQFREDKNFYYYKARPNAKIGKRSTILKRRKPTTKVEHQKRIKRIKRIKRNSTNSYQKPNHHKNEDLRKDSRRTTNSKINRRSHNSEKKVRTLKTNTRNKETKRNRRSL